jgi:hypothetical protein
MNGVRFDMEKSMTDQDNNSKKPISWRCIEPVPFARWSDFIKRDDENKEGEN